MNVAVLGCARSELGIPNHADGGSALACGAGTLLTDGSCEIARMCGAGTMLVGAVCVPIDAGAPSVQCGPGTELIGTTCSAIGDVYEVRVPRSSIPGDGHTSVDVVLFGRHSDGTPAVDDVIVTVSPSTAGTLDSYVAKLGMTPTNLHFTPCNVTTTANCEGPFHIQIRATTNLTRELARSADLSIYVPPDLGSSAPCVAAANAFYFEGDPGGSPWSEPKLLTDGEFYASIYPTGATLVSSIHLSMRTTSQDDGGAWTAWFSTKRMEEPLMTSVYLGAESMLDPPRGTPRLDVAGFGSACSPIFGAFQIERLTSDSVGIYEVLATFERRCYLPTAPALRGCVHYTRLTP